MSKAPTNPMYLPMRVEQAQLGTNQVIRDANGYTVALLPAASGSLPSGANAQAVANFMVKACNMHAELIDMLCRALPFVEDAAGSPDFKPGAVKQRIKEIRDLIQKAEA